MTIWFRIGVEESGTQTPSTHWSLRGKLRPFQAHHTAWRGIPPPKHSEKIDGFAKVVVPLLTGSGLKTEVIENKRLNPV
jgi:hypothetical protein